MQSSVLSNRYAPRRQAGLVPRALQGLVWLTEAVALALLWRVTGLLPTDWASAAGRNLMRALGPRLRRTRRIRKNMALAFPEKNEQEIDRLVRDVWGNFGQVLAEYPHLMAICRGGSKSRVDVVTRWDVETWRGAGKPTIFVSAHLGHPELAGSSIVTLGIPLTVVYSPQKNPLIDRMVQRRRRVLGCEFVTKEAAIRALLRDLESGRSIGLFTDQRVDEGELLPFFGRDALTTVSPARFALKFDCDLVPVRVERVGDARYRVTFHEPVRPDEQESDNQEKALSMMRQVNRLFESWIRERPQQWYCTKRRWPKTLKPTFG